MAKSNQTASDVQLKARRTSLEKKTNCELINIILRKDSTERKNNIKIQKLTALLKEADELNENKANRILNFDKDMKGMLDSIKTKQEQIDNITCEKNNYHREVIRLKNICRIRRKVIFTCFGIIAILIVLLILF